MRLIDADALSCRNVRYMNGQTGTAVSFKDIINAPTVDAAPVVRSHFIRQSQPYEHVQRFRCEKCDKETLTNKNNYCPNCGSKMEVRNETH